MSETTSVSDEPRTTSARKVRRLSNGRVLTWWFEVLAVLAFYGIYSMIRNAIVGNDRVAFDHARALISVQETLGFNVEEAIQRWALHSKALIVSMNYVYGSLHFIVTAGVGIYLFRRWTDDYPRWRNTMALMTLIALVCFWAWPLMPPRWLPEFSEVFNIGKYQYVDTLAKYPTLWSFNSATMSKISNQYAAMPSLHCGWSLWCACAMVPRVTNRWIKLAFIAYPLLTLTAIVLTGNHFILDAVGGWAVFGIAYAAVRLVSRRQLRPSP